VGSGAERERLDQANRGWERWRRWGPYVAERAWGTVREDYSADGDAWSSLPYDQARSRAYRWSEDGLAAVCDDAQTFCLGLALWNGVDPVLKERPFGLTGPQGNHGEDAKDYWWYIDSTPTHSWMRWRYAYPQQAFPYQELVAENGRRSREEDEYELSDTGIFSEHRYWTVTADFAKAAPEDLLLRISLHNHGPEAATLHVLPTLWFRNTWRWSTIGGVNKPPQIVAKGSVLRAQHPRLGTLTLSGSGEPTALACDNESNFPRLFGAEGPSRYPKDGINDHVVGRAPTVAPDGVGTKAALHYVVQVPAGERAEIRIRLAQGEAETDLGDDFAAVLTDRAREATEFYAELTPAGISADRAAIMRQAFGSLLWSKQFYHLEVDRWLIGDPNLPSPPERRLSGRNIAWRHFVANDVICMPDKWEYPWFSQWDLGFTCVALAHVDPRLAKDQLLLIARESYMHPSGQLPAYEWSFDDVNPPMHAWAALRVFEVDGRRDVEFLRRMLQKLMLHYTWWVNRTDSSGSTVFDPRFAPDGLSSDFQPAYEQGTGLKIMWVALYTLHLLEMALTVAAEDRAYSDIAITLFERLARLAAIVDEGGYWDEKLSSVQESVQLLDGSTKTVEINSLFKIIPLCTMASLPAASLNKLPDFANWIRWFTRERPELFGRVTQQRAGRVLIGLMKPDQIGAALADVLDPASFLSGFGLRSMSADPAAGPQLAAGSFQDPPTIRYEPGHTATGLFGGNVNWHGPVWIPLNYLVIDALRRYDQHLEGSLTVEYPTGSGVQRSLGAVADDLAARIIALFERGPDGRRPVHGPRDQLWNDLGWHDRLPFSEFFHAETGAGLGAEHCTGWTALVAALIRAEGDRSG
jgi:hypothetical protein